MGRLKKLLRQKKRILWILIWCTSAYLLFTEVRNKQLNKAQQGGGSGSKVGTQQARLWSSPSSSLSGLKSRTLKGEGYCSEKEYLEGAWVKRQVPLKDFDDVRRAYQFQVSERTSRHALAWKPVQSAAHQLAFRLDLDLVRPG